MQSGVQIASISKTSLWAGRIISGLVTLFMIFDGTVKVLKLPAAMEGTARLGYPISVVFPLGVVVLACTALYVAPQTSILGAILLTGFLGGATATQVRVNDPWFLFPVAIGVMAWGGLYLRDARLRSMIPLRNS
jgi:hypothetical protein